MDIAGGMKSITDSMRKIGECKACGDNLFSFSGEDNNVETLCPDCKKDAEIQEGKLSMITKIKTLFASLESSKDTRIRLRVPKRYLESTLTNFVGNVSGDVEKWLKSKTENLLIQSPKAGNGKTHLAISCMIEIMKRLEDDCVRENIEAWELVKPSYKGGRYDKDYTITKPNATFVNFSDLMLEVKASFDSKEITEQEVIKKYCEYTVVVIDDIGAEKSSDYTQAVIYSIINRRYEDMKPTIITTNLSSGDITGSYGSRILSRVASGTIITLDGNDKRLEK